MKGKRNPRWECLWIGCGQTTDCPVAEGWRLLAEWPELPEGLYCAIHADGMEHCWLDIAPGTRRGLFLPEQAAQPMRDIPTNNHNRRDVT
jgi:ligand-binding sensor domain-containing protein